jgi:hypothetical protein
MLHAAGLSVLVWVLLSERYHVHTRSDEECDRLLHAYHLDLVHQGYIGGMLLEKFYNRGWVDYVLLVLTPHRAAGRRGIAKRSVRLSMVKRSGACDVGEVFGA